MSTVSLTTFTVVHKLSIQPPTAFLVRAYMVEIASTYNVDYFPPEIEDTHTPMAAPSGFSVPVSGAANLGHVYAEPEVVIQGGSVPPNLPPGWTYTNDGLLSRNDGNSGQQQPLQPQPGDLPPMQANQPPPPYVDPSLSHDLPPQVAKVSTAPPKADTPDLYVPPAPEVPPSQAISTASTKDTEKGGGGDGKGGNDEEDGSEDGAPKYDDLAARFQALKR